MRRDFYAALLVLLIELLWVRIDTNGWYSPGQWRRTATRISVGFPLPAVSFTAHRTMGNMPPGTNYPERSEWRPGVRAFPLYQLLAGLSAFALFFGIRWLLRFKLSRPISSGFALGVLFGILTRVSTRPATGTEFDDPATWLNAVWVFIALPAAICFLSRRTRSPWHPVLMLASALALIPWASLWFDQFWSWSRRTATPYGYRVLEPSFEDMVGAPLLLGCLVIGFLLLMRRFIPFFRTDEAIAAAKR